MSRDRFPRLFRRPTGLTALTAAAMASVLSVGCTMVPNPNPPRTYAGDFNHVTPEGWQGRRFTDNRFVLSEQYDTNADTRLDLWRYYDQGRLVAEERDLLGSGDIHYVAAWIPADGRLVSAARDREGRGTFDTQIEYVENRVQHRWRVAEDRNGDGYADRVLILEGPHHLFQTLGIDLATVPSVIDAIPRAHWRETRADPAFTGTLGPTIRFRDGVAYDRVAAYDAKGAALRVDRIPAGVDPDTWEPPAATESGDGLGPASTGEIASTAARDVAQRRNTRSVAPEESTAGAVPRNMMFRAPGQL